MEDRRSYRLTARAYTFDGLDYKRLGARLRMEREYAGIVSVKSLVDEMGERTGFKPSVDSVYRFENGARQDLSFLVAFCLTIAGGSWWYLLRDMIADAMPMGFDIASMEEDSGLREYTRAEKLFGDIARPQPDGVKKPLSGLFEIVNDPDTTIELD